MLFASCSEKQIKNGWYHITDGKTLTFDSSPIVTTVDFEVLRIDSALNSANVMTYIIAGKIKSGKAKAWANATERAIGKQIGFLYKGKVITAPQVNARIDSGNFQIIPDGFCNDREKMFELYESLVDERYSVLKFPSYDLLFEMMYTQCFKCPVPSELLRWQ